MSANLRPGGIINSFRAILILIPLALFAGTSAFAYSVADAYRVNDGVIYPIVEGHRVYAPGGTDGFYVLDIGDPTSIQLLGHYQPEGANLGRVMIRDGYAYVNDWNFGLRILDVRDPAGIAEVGSWEYAGNPDRALGQALRDNYFYYTPWGAEETQILDISDFDNIQPVGNFSVGNHSMQAGGVMTTRIYGDVFYASLGYGGFHSFDITNPLVPVYLDGVYHPEKSDDHNFTIRDGYAYLAGGDYGFYVLDVGDPADMCDVFAHQWTEGEDLNGKYIITLGPEFHNGLQYLFTWEQEYRMHVWDVTDPTNPLDVGVHYRASGYDMGRWVDHYNGYLVSGSIGGERVSTFDVTGYHAPEPGTLLLASTGILGADNGVVPSRETDPPFALSDHPKILSGWLIRFQ